eukprot:GFYU01068611.1.p1 GENE.GFYU01068611.1~~GFYU01068611.1.p1  ORF type:complete len:111 (+),score=18.14 GFYU01068611.1:51-335(+)
MPVIYHITDSVLATEWLWSPFFALVNFLYVNVAKKNPQSSDECFLVAAVMLWALCNVVLVAVIYLCRRVYFAVAPSAAMGVATGGRAKKMEESV